MDDLDRITHVPGMMGGRATIRGIRVTGAIILGQLGSGQTVDGLLEEFPYLEREDIMQALRYGVHLAHGNAEWVE
jgi:uncharacterized protein (DUF433 family)